MADKLDMYIPQWSLGTLPDDRGNEVIVLIAATASMEVRMRLCDKGNYRQTADKLAEGIRRLGSELKATPLITNVKDMPDGLRKIP